MRTEIARTLNNSVSGRFLTPKQVSDRLSMALTTVYLYCKTGRIPAVHIGKLWRIPEGALDSYLKKKLKEAAA